MSPADNLSIEIQWATESSITTTILVDKLAELAVHVSLLRFDRRKSGSFNRLSVQLGLQQNASSEDVVHVLNQVSGQEYQISNADAWTGSGSINDDIAVQKARLEKLHICLIFMAFLSSDSLKSAFKK